MRTAREAVCLLTLSDGVRGCTGAGDQQDSTYRDRLDILVGFFSLESRQQRGNGLRWDTRVRANCRNGEKSPLQRQQHWITPITPQHGGTYVQRHTFHRMLPYISTNYIATQQLHSTQPQPHTLALSCSSAGQLVLGGLACILGGSKASTASSTMARAVSNPQSSRSASVRYGRAHSTYVGPWPAAMLEATAAAILGLCGCPYPNQQGRRCVSGALLRWG